MSGPVDRGFAGKGRSGLGAWMPTVLAIMVLVGGSPLTVREAGAPDTMGPYAQWPEAVPSIVVQGDPVTFRAHVTDNYSGGSDIAEAEFYIDWNPNSTPPATPMDATDGVFDEVSEWVNKTVLATYSVGTHNLWVRGKDTAGNWGPFSIVSFEVVAPSGTTDDKGPVTSNVQAVPNPVVQGDPVTFSAFVDDSTTGGNLSAAAEFFIDSVGGNGTGTAMDATDGAFDEVSESVTKTVPASYSLGNHDVYVHGKDSVGNWGTFWADSFTVVSSPPPDSQGPITSSVLVNPDPVLQGSLVAFSAQVDDSPTGGNLTAAAEFFVDGPTGNGTGTAMDATDGAFDEISEAVNKTVAASYFVGAHTLCVHGKDSVGNWGPLSCKAFTVKANLVPGQPSLHTAALTGGNVVITFSPSPDDAGGENDVVGYRVYRFSGFVSGGAGYLLHATLPVGTTLYVDTGAGIGNPSDYFYCLRAVDGSGQVSGCTDQAAKNVRFFTAGRHLISIPTEQANAAISAVLQTLDFQEARTYQNPAGYGKNWLVFHKNKPWTSDFSITNDIALWVLVKTDSSLVTAGIIRGVETVPLKTGWNFRAYPSFIPRTVSTAFAGISYQTVEGFDPSEKPYLLRKLTGIDLLNPFAGLWIHVNYDQTWTLTN